MIERARDHRGLLIVLMTGLLVRMLLWAYFRTDILALVRMRLPDDALYYFTAARGFVAGHGITYDGIHPANGLHPLWLALISPLFMLSIGKWGLIHAVLLLQSLIDTLTIWLIGVSVEGLLPNVEVRNRRSAAIVAAALYAVSPIVLLHAINGLETSLAAMLLVLWTIVYVRWIAMKQSGAILGLVTGLLLLSRTDLFIVILPACLYLLVRKPSVAMRITIPAIVAAIIVLPWLVWNWNTFGTIVQSSAQAVPYFAMKKYEALYGHSRYFVLMWEAVRNSAKPFLYSTFGLGILPLIYCLRKQRRSFPTEVRLLFVLLMGGVLLLVVHSVFRGFVREWYVLQLVPLFLVGFGVSIALAAHPLGFSNRGRAVFAIAGLLSIAFTLKVGYRSQDQIVRTGLPIVADLTRSARVGALNSGYDSYFAARDGSVVNLDGVMNPSALSHIRSGDIRSYLRQDTIHYILDFRGDLGGYVGLIDRHMLDDYSIDPRLTGGSDGDLVLYRAHWLDGH